MSIDFTVNDFLRAIKNNEEGVSFAYSLALMMEEVERRIEEVGKRIDAIHSPVAPAPQQPQADAKLSPDFIDPKTNPPLPMPDAGDEAEKWMLSILRSFAASRLKPVQEKLQSMIPASFYGDRDLETRLAFLVDNWKALGNAANERDQLRLELEEAKSKLNPCYDEAEGPK